MSLTNPDFVIDGFRSTSPRLSEPISVFDVASGCNLVLGTPRSAPDLWIEYLDGARRLYAAHGVSAALDHDEVVRGDTTTLFYVAVDSSGVVRGGHRAQGPYLDVRDSHALVEWDGNEGRDELIRAIESRLAFGVVEMKTAWVDPAVGDPGAVSALLARVAIPTMTTTGARFIMATAAEHVLRRWSSSGGRVDKRVADTPYPDQRYRTSLMWWDRETMQRLADPAVWRQIREDALVWQGFVAETENQSVA
ncbi:hypothetical protein [Williamsia sp.]|uniref:hypothetical protein n=1 Tax=Williamsia sp. TaxID=1872085 RepID=UPI0025FBADE4|nr:hypothetical protein [Williamsia sp.]